MHVLFSPLLAWQVGVLSGVGMGVFDFDALGARPWVVAGWTSLVEGRWLVIRTAAESEICMSLET